MLHVSRLGALPLNSSQDIDTHLQYMGQLHAMPMRPLHLKQSQDLRCPMGSARRASCGVPMFCCLSKNLTRCCCFIMASASDCELNSTSAEVALLRGVPRRVKALLLLLLLERPSCSHITVVGAGTMLLKNAAMRCLVVSGGSPSVLRMQVTCSCLDACSSADSCCSCCCSYWYHWLWLYLLRRLLPCLRPAIGAGSGARLELNRH